MSNRAINVVLLLALLTSGILAWSAVLPRRPWSRSQTRFSRKVCIPTTEIRLFR